MHRFWRPASLGQPHRTLALGFLPPSPSSLGGRPSPCGTNSARLTSLASQSPDRPPGGRLATGRRPTTMGLPRGGGGDASWPHLKPLSVRASRAAKRASMPADSRKISRPHGRHREAWPSAGAVERAQSSCHLSERDHSLIRWPPPVTQAPTTQGVEPDFFFWRAAGARRRSRAGRLREGKRPGQRSPSWPRASRLTVMLKPAAEVAGQPARGRGIASERRVARTWPASGGARAEPLPSEALGAPWRLMASLGPSAFFQ